jgi:molybdenum cofactor cytidylyltransferase
MSSVPATEDCDCVIPAAGASTRMGAWKPLLPFAGTTIIGTVVAAALGVCSRVVLVTGYRGGELAARFRSEARVIAVENSRWALGMFSSVQLGVSRVMTRRFFVTLGDMPWITPAVYEALQDAAAGADVVFPAFGGRRGHPVLFHERVRDAVAAGDPAGGSMRAIAEAFQVRDLAWPDDSVIRDVDTPEDLGPADPR